MRLFSLLITILLIFSVNPVVSQSSDNLEFGVYTSVKSDYTMSYNMAEEDNRSYYGFEFRTQIWNYQTSEVSIWDHCNPLSLEVEGEIENFVDLISGELMPVVGVCEDDLVSTRFGIEVGELRGFYAVVAISMFGNHSNLPSGNYQFSFTNVIGVHDHDIFPFNVTISVEQNGDLRKETVIEDSVVDNFGQLDPFETAEISWTFNPIILTLSFAVSVLLVKKKTNKNT